MLGAPFARGAVRTSFSIAALAAVGVLATACGSSDGDHPGGPPYQVGGTVYATADSAVDSDVNDFHSPFAPNDSAAQAQTIRNPVTLGGHVNQPGKGAAGSESGRTFASGDLQDWFRVSIAAGQTIRLQIAEENPIAEDPPRNDLDLELRALDETLVASSATGSQTEEIVVAATGDYYVVVLVKADFSNYTLTIGDVPGSTASLAREPEFVPGQVVVRYRDVRGSSRSAVSPAARARSIRMRHVSGDSDGPMLFAAETLAERRQAFQALGIAPTAEMQGTGQPRGERGLRDDTRRIAAALRHRAEVRSADLNYVRRATAIPTDQFYPRQWHYELIRLPEAWDITLPNSGVVVAVIDTGVKLGHPDLTGQLVTGFDFVSDAQNANDGDGCDANPDDPGDSLPPDPSSYHGTHVAGTVAARASFASGDATGVAGVAWNARILPLRVLGVFGGTDADIMSALRYAAGRAGTCAGPGSSTPARIVNMSLGGVGFSQTFQDLITDLRNNEGMIFVAAAGNEATLQPVYPASYAGVISVSAVGPTKTRAPYSNFGFTIDVAAPGGDMDRDVNVDGFPDGVFSTLFLDGIGFNYDFYEGTSMAAPHVAGVFALMLGVNPALTTFDIDNALNSRQITEDIGSSQLYGNGLIDAARAVDYAATNPGGAPLDPVLRVDPDVLNFGFFATELPLVVSNGGNADEPLTVTGVSFASGDGGAWLTVTPQSVDASGLGTYRATVDRSGLDEGIYTGTITFTSSENDVVVDVILSAGDLTSAQANAGHQYILLTDTGPHPREEQAEVDVHVATGSYAFGFPTTAPGAYLLIAGTDHDGDLFICDSGEACGAYPSTETSVPFTVDRDLIDLKFLTGFAPPFGSAAAGAGGSQPGHSIDR
jgi:serine protease